MTAPLPDLPVVPPPDDRTRRIMLWVVAVGFFMQTLDSTIVNTALPSMARSLGESPLRMQSVVIAYSLTMAVIIPASGWLADRFGTRTIFQAAIGLFVAGSLLCAYAPTLNFLVGARVVQGVGGAMLLPVGRLSVLRTFPREQYLQALSFVAIPGMIGPLIGPTLGGWLTQALSWHWIFLINVPVGLLGALATIRYMPNARLSGMGRFDIAGYLLLATAMLALSFSLDGLAGLGFQHATVLMLLIASMAALTAYGLHANRRKQPLFPLRLFRIHSFSVGLLGNLFARIGNGSMPFLIPLTLQVSLGYSPFDAGLMMLPVTAAGMASKRLATRLIQRHGYRRVLVSNTFVVGLVMAAFALITPQLPLWLLIPLLAVFGMVNSIQFTAMNTVTLKDLSGAGASSGNSMLSMVQMLSMSLAVTSAGALLATFQHRFGGDTAAVLPAFHATFACMGLITCASAWIFMQLGVQEAAPALPVRHGEKEV
ncbi:MFS transporter [Cupriavidus sp. TA19]|uniref:multidrug transporter subunit MdtD n=1 Tax=unclassified Cupriavidus TaxID=2640874 RepID=UPI000ED14CCB|nr:MULTISPECIES: multidrug transporter subunit MdtD [unclassified Cupriavidus]BDB28141.1 multidrug transporter subunit MdtD [Cupriavidus sp. P-10]GLC94225.1 MFS transporter [Cupriavidus sp. TA19]